MRVCVTWIYYKLIKKFNVKIENKIWKNKNSYLWKKLLKNTASDITQFSNNIKV